MILAVSGLGRMGSQIAQKLIDAGHEVIGHDPSRLAVDTAATGGALAAYDTASVIAAFAGRPVVLWLMIPSNAVQSTLTDWLSILPAGSIVIDGGNSDYRDDPARSAMVTTAGSTLLDIGTSGGVWGRDNGFSLMVGGDQAAYRTIAPILDSLTLPRGGHQFLGPSGSGHYVKMVHNAIEYGMMESLAEGYHLLKEGPYANIDLARAGDVWQQSSVISSWLNDLTRQVLHENPNLDDVSGVVAESGEARWALETATQRGIPLPAVQAAYDMRLSSQNGSVDFSTKLLAAMRNKFGGHHIDGQS